MVVHTAIRALDRNTLATVEAMMIATRLARDLTVQSKVALRTEAVHKVFRRVFPKILVRQLRHLIGFDAEVAQATVMAFESAVGDLSLGELTVRPVMFGSTVTWAVRFLRAEEYMK